VPGGERGCCHLLRPVPAAGGQHREQAAGWAPGAGPYGAHRTLQTLLCLHIRFYLATPARAELTRFGAVCRLQAGRPRLESGLGVNWGELG
jgi:hypothetical protein